jgi:cephalosporin hydroxylase
MRLARIRRRLARSLTEWRAPARVDAFHRLYYDDFHQTWAQTLWLGTRAFKCPFDLWMYQELLAAIRPDLLVETGTAAGGSALFLASCMDMLGNGRIVTIDINDRADRPQHDRITYVHGSSVDPEVVDRVRGLAADARAVIVVLDSDHRRDHVLAEMRAYSTLVTQGSYLIVEDTNVNGHPVLPDFGPGPHEAVETFLAEGAPFVRDRSCERFLMTFNPGGYLRREED